jgi:cobalt-zinc-cadmium efflux system membrane fusion protein
MNRAVRVALLACVLLGCGAPPAEATEEPSAASAPTRWVRVRAPEDLSLLEAPARVVSTTTAAGEVTAPMTMRVARVHVAPGQHVDEGDPVLDVVAPDVLTAAAQWIAASRQLGVHRDRRTTLEGLRGEGIVEESRVFEQTARVAELSADQAAALAVLQSVGLRPGDVAATLRSGTITLRAPLAGIIRDLDVRLGEVRQPGDGPFARIIGTATPRIEVRASQAIPETGTATFRGTDGTEVVLGSAVASVVDPIDGTHVAWLDPAVPGVALSDGLRGAVRWGMATDAAFEVPAQAIRIEPGRTVVLRQTADAPEPIEVHVLIASSTTAIVTGALTLEDEVAADAATVLRPPESAE